MLNDTIYAKKSFISAANVGCHGIRKLCSTEIAFQSTRQEYIGPVPLRIHLIELTY